MKKHLIERAHLNIRSLFNPTPLNYHNELSTKLKREDLTPVRSYKIRGAFNKMNSLINKNGIVSCSAGNHAQGVAYSSTNYSTMATELSVLKITM